MMDIILIIIFPFELFQIIESRLCSIDQGVGCCYGFLLNETTGKCDKCSVGYYGNECSEKCFPPTYGEDCQSLCNCPVEQCHFVNGCVQRQQIATEHTRLTNAFPNITVLNRTSVSYSAIVKILSTDANRVGDTTLIQTDLLKNNIVIGFIGFFVISFFLFVLTYMYFKCFRKAAQTIHIQENKAQAQYKSLNFDPVEHHESQSRLTTIADSMYLSPVFSRNECSEQRPSSENEIRSENDDILQETTLHGQEIGHETLKIQNKQNLSEEDVECNVYIEITEDRIERC